MTEFVHHKRQGDYQRQGEGNYEPRVSFQEVLDRLGTAFVRLIGVGNELPQGNRLHDNVMVKPIWRLGQCSGAPPLPPRLTRRGGRVGLFLALGLAEMNLPEPDILRGDFD